MKLITTFFSLILFSSVFASSKVGNLAPNFNEKDQNGKVQKFEDYKGKWVVLEWFNEDCPYVKKHYGSGNMQMLQKNYIAKNVAWLTVASSAAGKQGYVAPGQATDQMNRVKMASTALLLDSDGTMGVAYGAQTTPHMFVINPEGKIVYAGAIDSDDSSDPSTIKTADNYVVDALDSGMNGKPIKTTSTKPYGCSVKYN